MELYSKDSFSSYREIKTIVFDFDGVFTDNKVWVNESGDEWVRCDRGDGLAFDLLRNFIEKNNWNLDYFILSKEQNKVVSSRANKIKVRNFQGVESKIDFMQSYFKKNSKSSKGFIFLGNDLNDLGAMSLAEFVVAPKNSHPKVLEIADLVISRDGGDSFVREFIEILIGIKELPAEAINDLLVFERN